jgi:hypothetical protein
MYPADELERLALHKRRLMAQSDALRVACIDASVTLERPFIIAKRAATLWERVSFLLTPLSVILAARRKTVASEGLLKTAVKWAPKLFRLARILGPLAGKR